MTNVFAMITGFAVLMLGFAVIVLVGLPIVVAGTVREQVVLRSRLSRRSARPDRMRR